MIKVEKALEIVLSSIQTLPPERVKLLSSLDRVLVEDIYSNLDLPPFDNSAMDGYALIASETKRASLSNPKILDILEDLPAGQTTTKEIKRGTAIRIMTGAPIPKGADAVIMVEHTQSENSKVTIFKEVRELENIRQVGEDVKKGDLVMTRGSVIRAAELGILASLGLTEVNVVRSPRVAILATGNELVDPGKNLSPGKIRSSNSYTIYAQVLRYGGIPVNLGIAKDDPDEVKDRIESGLTSDMVLTSGGVSVGKYDIVKDALAELGIEIKFWKVAMKPGKPLLFGLIRGTPVFGLPGNSVASMVSFEQFVRPAILKMSGGRQLRKPEILATTKEDIRKKPGSRHFIRGRVKVVNGRYEVRMTGPQGSGILSSMTLANALIVIPEDVTLVKSGQEVRLQLLDQPEVE